ncbi:MAG: hypothetical protein ACO3KD_05270 [Gaiellales bacterium]
MQPIAALSLLFSRPDAVHRTNPERPEPGTRRIRRGVRSRRI